MMFLMLVHKKSTMKKLTPKQEHFCQVYIETGNASEAYRTAYNVKDKTTMESINTSASVLMSDPKISSRVKELEVMTAKKHEITRDLIIKGYLEIIADADETFNLARLKDADKDETKRFFRMMQQTKNADKIKAYENLTKMLGFNEPDKTNITVNFKTGWGQ